MRLAVVVVLSFLVLASAGMGKTIILSQTINVNGSAVNDTNNYVTAVSATNDTGSHTFRFSREGLPNLSVTINDQTGGGSPSGGNMSQWYIDADTGTAFTVLNESLIRILSGTGISTSIVGGDIFIENTGVINEADPLSCHTDGSSCPAFVTYAGLNTILNGQNNLSLLQIKNNIGNYTANPAGYYNSTTLPTWAYNASYVTYTVLNGQANVSPASITGNLTSYATTAALNTGLAGQHNVSPASITGNLSSYATNTALNTALAGQHNVSPASITGNLTSYATNAAVLANVTGVNDSWKANVTGYYPRNANPLGYINTTTTVDLSSYVNLTILNGQNNLSLANIVTNIGNYTANPAGYYNVSTLPGGGGDNSSWRQDVYWANATASFYPLKTNPLSYQNITCTGGNSTHANVTNGSTCIMVAQNPGAGSSSATSTVLNYSYQDGYISTQVGSLISTSSILNLNSTAKCNSFLVDRGKQLVFNNMSYMVATTNASVGMYISVYNCTSANGLYCTSGNILLNSSIIRLATAGGLNGTFTNTTGNWVLPSGNYVMCVSTNVTNAQGAIFKSSTAVTSPQLGTYTITGLKKGAFPSTATFSLNPSSPIPLGWLYNVQGVMN